MFWVSVIGQLLVLTIYQKYTSKLLANVFIYYLIIVLCEDL